MPVYLYKRGSNTEFPNAFGIFRDVLGAIAEKGVGDRRKVRGLGSETPPQL